MNKPYMKKLLTLSNFTVWLVNGLWVRRYKSIAFTDYGYHSQFKFIPQNEIWVDHEAVKHVKEISKIVREAMVEIRNFKKMGPVKAFIAGEISAGHFRTHPKVIKKILNKSLSRPGAKVYVVNSEQVRDKYYQGFVQGGHGYVYKFIPKDEIWISDGIIPKERKFVFAHENHERNLMIKGWPYIRAHNSANIIELAMRRKKCQ
jgi:hypothetical protein